MVRFLHDKSNGRWVRFWVMHFAIFDKLGVFCYYRKVKDAMRIKKRLLGKAFFVWKNFL